MAQRCFVVYPLPFVANESFLDVMFDGGVRRSVFAGYAAGRFALVEMRDDETAQRVHRAIASAPLNTTGAASHRGPDGVDWGDDSTLEELFNARPVAAWTRKNSKSNKSNDNGADGAARPSGIAHIGCLQFRGTPLQVVPSPIALEEIYRCGVWLPGHPTRRNTGAEEAQGYAKKETFTRKRRCAGEDETTTPFCEETAAKHARRPKGRQEGAMVSSTGGDACRRCGSTGHFTRQCTADLEALATDDRSGVWQHAPPVDSCQKCGSSAHFTRHCDAVTNTNGDSLEPERSQSSDMEIYDAIAADVGGGYQSEEELMPRVRWASLVVSRDPLWKSKKQQQEQQQRQEKREQQPEQQQRQQQQQKLPEVVCTSKDLCKYCGSNLHFSRHCPSK